MEEKPKPQCWNSSDIIDFSWGTLRYVTQGRDIDKKAKRTFSVEFRKEGEKINLEGRCTKKLKKLFQELSIPPWERPLIPIIYEAGELVALGGVSVKGKAEKFNHLKRLNLIGKSTILFDHSVIFTKVPILIYFFNSLIS